MHLHRVGSVKGTGWVSALTKYIIFIFYDYYYCYCIIYYYYYYVTASPPLHRPYRHDYLIPCARPPSHARPVVERHHHRRRACTATASTTALINGAALLRRRFGTKQLVPFLCMSVCRRRKCILTETRLRLDGGDGRGGRPAR